MCTGRVDLAFVLRAFSRGADGVIVGGCWPGECHYVTEGNYDALGTMHIGRKLLREVGLEPGRLALEWIAASEGARFAEVMTAFATRLREWGPLGEGPGEVAAGLGLRLEAASRLVPYLKLVEREKLRVPEKNVEAYERFFGSEEVDRLFRELFADRLAVGQVMLLLRGGPLSTRQIAETLAWSPAEVARHMKSSSSQGLVRYDRERGSYALA